MKRRSGMRLFIAVNLSEEMKKSLIGFMHDLKKQGVEGSFVPAQNLHMTLAFIGEYDDPARVREIIGKVPFPEFRLSLSETGNFGNIFWVGVKGNQKPLIRKMSAKKPYQIRLPKADMTVKKAALMKTDLKGGRAVYKEL